MSIKLQAQQLHQAINQAARNIVSILQQEGCGYRMYASPILDKGIMVEFLFRGETDYSLIFPWEYTQDDNKIRDYYRRFQEYSKDSDIIPDVARFADSFYEEEAEKLNKG